MTFDPHAVLNSLFNNMEDRLIILDRDSRVVEVNKALLRHCGKREKVIGKPCHLVLLGEGKSCDLHREGCPTKVAWRTGRSSRAMLVHSNGADNTFYIDIIASPLRDLNGEIVSVIEIARDVTEIKHLEDLVVRTSEELSTLISLSSVITCSMDLRAMLGLALDHVLALMNATIGGILVDGREGKKEPMLVVRGIDPGEVSNVIGTGYIPEDRMEIRRANWNGKDLLCVPISTKENVLGEMFFSCPTEQWMSSGGLKVLVSIGSQLAVAIENARLYEAVHRKEEAISAFVRKYMTAQREERKRIARDLHDETAQTIAALAVTLDAAMQSPEGSSPDMNSQLKFARDLTDRMLIEIREIIRDLRPSLLDDQGFLEAIAWHADNQLSTMGLPIIFNVNGGERRLSSELETALFRVGQEAISNIARHAKAKIVNIEVNFSDDSVTMKIEDDGIGFDVDSVMAREKYGIDSSSFGLIGMRERMELVGGTLIVSSSRGQGTVVHSCIPVPLYHS